MVSTPVISAAGRNHCSVLSSLTPSTTHPDHIYNIVKPNILLYYPDLQNTTIYLDNNILSQDFVKSPTHIIQCKDINLNNMLS